MLFQIIPYVATAGALHFQETLAQVPLIIRAVHHLIRVEDVMRPLFGDRHQPILVGERRISIPQRDKLSLMLDVQVPLVVVRLLRLVSSIALGLIDLFSLDPLPAILLLPKSVQEGQDYGYVWQEEPEDQDDCLVDGTKYMDRKPIAYKYQVSFLKLVFRMSWYQGVDMMEFMVTLISKERIMHRFESRI